MCAYHLPALWNPLLNVLFNNPSLETQTALVQELQAHLNVSVLVPPAHSLAGVAISEDFIRSHIIRNASGMTSASPGRRATPCIYTTLNGKQVLVKNGHVFSGKGFRDSRKVAVTGFDGVAAWAAYLPRGSVYGCVHISGPLCGPVAADTPSALFPVGASASGMSLVATGAPSGAPSATPSGAPSATPSGAPSAAPSNAPEPTFSDLLQNFPALSRTMAPAFYSLFHHNNRQFHDLRSRNSLPLSQIKRLFAAMVAQAFRIVQDMISSDSSDGDRVYNLLTSVSMKNPGLDMNRLVHEFVEFNIYDRLWSSLVFQFTHPYTIDTPGAMPDTPGAVPDTPGAMPDTPGSGHSVFLTPEFYRDLSCLSLNQLDIPVDEPWSLNVLYSRVEAAIKVFSELAGPGITNQREKVGILTRTVQVLTDRAGSAPLVDADTLIGLLIMVVVHSKVPNLECHLFYISHFGLADNPTVPPEEPGYLDYILSNFDAVVYHLRGPVAKEIRASSENYAFWAAIQRGSVSQVEAILSQVDPNASPPKSHFLHSKNIHGESFWFLAIRANNTAVFELLATQTQPWSCIEDVVFDINTSTRQNLLMVALQHENAQIIHPLIDILECNLTDAEMAAYVNWPDHRGRHVGHYLLHDLTALRRLGRHVDWAKKDHNSHTPLFSFCRAYDHPAYAQLLQTAFHISAVPYNLHTDKNGNTLLHALARGIPESGLLAAPGAVDVNELNARGLSPASLSMRYNRLENLQQLLREKSFVFGAEDPKSFHNLSDNYSFSAAKKNHTGVSDAEFVQIEKLVVAAFFDHFFPKKWDFGVISGKYDAAKADWQIHTVSREPSCSAMSLTTLKKIIKALWMSNPHSFMPMETLWLNFPETRPNHPVNSKYRFNRLLEHVNMFMSSLAFTAENTQALFRDLVRSPEESIFEMARPAKEKRPAARLDPQSISEMYYFVDFSKKNLVRYQQVIRRLSNLTSCCKVKHDDVAEAHDGLLTDLQIRSFRRDTFVQPWKTFHGFVAWTEACIVQLLSQCDLLFGKIHLWETLYKQIKALNKELAELESVVFKAARIPRKSTFSVEEVPADEQFKDDSDFTSLFGLGDSKKAKYKRLVALKAEHVTRITELTASLRHSHEAVAAEMSQFLPYRSGFLALGLKRLARDSVASLRHRNVQLEKCLETVRAGRAAA